ncbi:MAG: hypothetical protein LBI43_08030 [Streptococcaceae bacterium]|jgi:hypothetical protein|nr:hypothetical protein [Streptococcaceae bacterium]
MKRFLKITLILLIGIIGFSTLSGCGLSIHKKETSTSSSKQNQVPDGIYYATSAEGTWPLYLKLTVSNNQGTLEFAGSDVQSTMNQLPSPEQDMFKFIFNPSSKTATEEGLGMTWSFRYLDKTQTSFNLTANASNSVLIFLSGDYYKDTTSQGKYLKGLFGKNPLYDFSQMQSSSSDNGEVFGDDTGES